MKKYLRLGCRLRTINSPRNDRDYMTPRSAIHEVSTLNGVRPVYQHQTNSLQHQRFRDMPALTCAPGAMVVMTPLALLLRVPSSRLTTTSLVYHNRVQRGASKDHMRCRFTLKRYKRRGGGRESVDHLNAAHTTLLCFQHLGRPTNDGKGDACLLQSSLQHFCLRPTSKTCGETIYLKQNCCVRRVRE